MRKQVVLRWLKRRKDQIISSLDYDAFGTTIRLRENLYGILTKSPLYSSDAWVYLLLGKEKALVIDTGFGIGDLRSHLERLSGGLSLIVFNTHFHIDHSLGNSQFEEVYINEQDADLLPSTSFTDYSKASGRAVIDHSFYQESDVLPFTPYKVHRISDHFKIDLGDLEIEAFHVPGHSSGGMVLLDRTDRILFSGDALLYPFPAPLAYAYHTDPVHPELMTVTAFAKGLSHLLPHLSEFDFLCDGHGLPLSPAMVLEDMYYCANDITANPDTDYQTISTQRGEARLKCFGCASILYIPERV